MGVHVKWTPRRHFEETAFWFYDDSCGFVELLCSVTLTVALTSSKSNVLFAKELTYSFCTLKSLSRGSQPPWGTTLFWEWEANENRVDTVSSTEFMATELQYKFRWAGVARWWRLIFKFTYFTRTWGWEMLLTSCVCHLRRKHSSYKIIPTTHFLGLLLAKHVFV